MIESEVRSPVTQPWAHRNALSLVAAVAWLVSAIAHEQLGLSVLGASYESLRLFVLDGTVELRLEPGNETAYYIVWFLRFAAPALTAGFLYDVARRMGLTELVPWWWRDHVVVVGMGRLGQEFCAAARRNGKRVVAIDVRPDLTAAAPSVRGIRVIRGDATQRSTLRAARVHRARVVVAVTPDDITNLNVALLAIGIRVDATSRQASGSQLKAYAHVFDVSLKENVRRTLGEQYRQQLELFNSYEMAASGLFETLGDDAIEGRPSFVVAGLGRFGTCIFRHLLKELGDASRLTVIDPSLVDSPAEAGGPTIIAEDMLSSTVREHVQSLVRAGQRVHFLVCTDNDVKNLHFALSMAQLGDDSEVRVYTRMFRWPAHFVDLEAGELQRIRALNLVELFRRRIPAELRDVFL